MSTDLPQGSLNLLLKGTVACHTAEDLSLRLLSGRPLCVKVGFDPTAPDLHLGHAALLKKMAQFQKLGHRVIFLIGDFTGMIGDPTGKKATRPPLSREEIAVNAETYKSQVFKILDSSLTEIRFNSEWLEPLGGEGWIRLAAKTTLAQLLERNDFAKRMSAHEPIALHELLYPLAQAYDSVALKCDVELGGNDQLFNLMRGRDLQIAFGQAPQVVMTLPLLLGTDGIEKMSKSLGNYIGFNEDADTQYGKTMSISDETMWGWYLLLTDALPSTIEEIKNSHPMEAKKALAKEIATQFHGDAPARAAEEKWVRRFSERKIEDAPAVKVPPTCEETPLARLLAEKGLAASRKDAERLISQGAVSVDGQKISDCHAKVWLRAGDDLLVKVGKIKLQRWVVK
jgi:tyrosyl-tRNA synthetase